jgi:mono/diheme cytochrome c family protein
MTDQNNDNTPKPLPMKAIVWSVSGLFATLAIGFLIIPAFFDSTPFGLLFHKSAPPWALDPATEAKLQLTEAQAKGRYHFIQYCAGCHGPEGRGNGSLSQTLNRKLPNFLHPVPAGLKNDLTIAGVTKTLVEGIAGSQMPAFSHLPSDVISEIAQYVEHLHKNPSLY